MEAFEQLFVRRGLKSKDDWPTKQEVRHRAEEILQKAGRVVPGERQWPRILKKAGLSELPSAPWGGTPATVYYLRIETPKRRLYKIGITTRSIAVRFSPNSAKIKILKTWQFAKGSRGDGFEQNVLRDNAHDLYRGKPILPDGNDELFTRDVLGLDDAG